MSSRGSIAQHQGRASLKRTNIGHSKSTECLMVYIPWTDAKTVRISANKDFSLRAHTVRVLHDQYTTLADVSINVHEGQVLYFVQSDGFPGMYYILTYNGTKFSCSCIHCSKFYQSCDHQQHATVYVGHRHAERMAKIKEVAIEKAADLREYKAMIREAEERQALLERQYENICSEPYDDGTPPMPPEVLALYISEPGTMDEPPRAADIWQGVEDLEESSIA